MSEVKAHLLPPGDWRRRLHGPYQIIAQDVETGMYLTSDPTDHVEGALRALLEEDPFPQPNRKAVTIDVDGWIVFGYSTDPKFIKAFDHPAFWGSEFGFAMIESTGLVDSMELALMETWARGLSDGDEWWQ